MLLTSTGQTDILQAKNGVNKFIVQKEMERHEKLLQEERKVYITVFNIPDIKLMMLKLFTSYFAGAVWSWVAIVAEKWESGYVHCTTFSQLRRQAPQN